MPSIGTWVVYIAYLIIIVSIVLTIWVQHIGGEGISGLFLVGGFIIFAFLILLVAPVLQIAGIYSLWIKKSPERPNCAKRKKIWERAIACVGYLLNVLAFIWFYQVLHLS